MKDWFKKLLGINKLEIKNVALEMKLRQLDRRIGRLNSRALRYDEIERARKLAKKQTVPTAHQ